MQRNGKSYVIINDFSTACDASKVGINFIYLNIATFVTNTISKAVNGNWKTCKNILYPSLEKYAVGVFESFLLPIFNGIPCQDFYNM